MRILGIIPARSGSKGVANKNIRNLNGKPLIWWTAIEALQSKLDKVVLSTDSRLYAMALEDCFLPFSEMPIEVPFLRSKELAGDKPRLPEVCRQLIEHYDKQGEKFDAVMLLQPTAPLRKFYHINRAIDTFKQISCDSLVSVVEVPTKYNPEWLFVEDGRGFMKVCNGKEMKDRIKARQDFPKAYMTNGAIYLFTRECLFQDPPNLYGERTLPFVMDEENSLSIDTLEDFDEAERRLKLRERIE